jgi:hypothetical protein
MDAMANACGMLSQTKYMVMRAELQRLHRFGCQGHAGGIVVLGVSAASFSISSSALMTRATRPWN